MSWIVYVQEGGGLVPVMRFQSQWEAREYADKLRVSVATQVTVQETNNGASNAGDKK